MLSPNASAIPADEITSGANMATREFVALGAPTLIVAGPALSLLRQWDAELAVLRRRSPGSDAVMTLSNCVRELAHAINAARDTRLHLTIADVHAMCAMPVSTLRWLCKHKPDAIGAQKHEGVWYIERAKFERYIATSDHEAPMGPLADRQGVVDAVDAA